VCLIHWTSGLIIGAAVYQKSGSNPVESEKKKPFQIKRVRVMTFNTIFNNISVLSWRSILLVEETTDLSQVTDKFNHIISVKTRTVTSLSDTPRLQYYDVQTLEYRYISKLPMKKEQIWSNVKETTSHLQNKLTKNIHIGVATRSS
jgi:hypothetical protein